MLHVLVTGAAGFVGYHLARRLLADGHRVTGVDNFCPYYSVELKRNRLAQLAPNPNFQFVELELADRPAVAELFTAHRFDRVAHLAAQAGVRYSIDNPAAYIDSNLVALGNVLEGCRHQQSGHLVFASSSSVYGANKKSPFSTADRVDHPVSLYAATKKAGELMAHTYSHLYELPTTCLRFFTVYGPWGRPDMAIYKFTEAMLAGRPIDVYNQGQMRRDFTYVDDIVEGVVRVLALPPVRGEVRASDTASDTKDSETDAPFRLYNIGNHQPVTLDELITTLESSLGLTAERRLLPLQPGDMVETYADIGSLTADTGFRPTTPLATGIQAFVEWYREYHA
ncbi:NAD-dependent epimerase/dehydratase family protein [Aeoliella sp. SH292]|uniref:NAD-dependent epimerase/dehydratase family protein n=1 Tax=Aeoliella sp. SH292 TaxID=3454464 RepID=UPI003F996248